MAFLNKVSATIACVNCFWKALYLYGALYASRLALNAIVPSLPKGLGEMVTAGTLGGDFLALYTALLILEWTNMN